MKPNKTCANCGAEFTSIGDDDELCQTCFDAQWGDEIAEVADTYQKLEKKRYEIWGQYND
jgi:predicted amidophosphoribosyltransferase